MGKKGGTCAAVRLIEGVRLIWGPLNTGLTVHPENLRTDSLLVSVEIVCEFILRKPIYAKFYT